MNALRRSALTSMATLWLASAVGCAEGVDPQRAAGPATGAGGATATGGIVGTGLTPTGSGAVTGVGGSLPGTGGAGTMAGGMAGAGGTNPSAGGASGAGGQQSVDAGPPAIGVVVAQYQVPDGENFTDGNIVAHIRLENRSTRALPVAALTIRYWYTLDAAAPSTTGYQVIEENYSDMDRISGGTTSVKYSFGKMAKPQTGADHYLEIGFNGPYEMQPGGVTHQQSSSTNQIEMRAHWPGYSNTYDETNDYSWDGTKTNKCGRPDCFVDWAKVTVYQNGVLVWGTEPDGTKPKPPSDGGTDAGGSTDGATDGASPPADAGRG